MLEVILRQADGVTAKVTGLTSYELVEGKAQVTLVQGEKRFTIYDVSQSFDVEYEYDTPYDAWGPKMLVSPCMTKTTVNFKVLAVPVHALLHAFGTVQVTAGPSVYGNYFALPQESANEELVDQLNEVIPGMNALAEHPEPKCGSHSTKAVRSLVIHLNDTHKWTYQQIADWLDTLDVDLSVQEPTEDDLGSLEAIPLGWQDIGYIEEGQLDTFHQQGGKASNHFTQGKTIGTTEGMGCMTVDFDGIKEQIQKLYTGTTDKKED